MFLRKHIDFAGDRLSLVPEAWRSDVAKKYAGKIAAALAIPAGTGRQSDAERAANIWLDETAARFRVIRVPLNSSDADLCRIAVECANAAYEVAFRPWGDVKDLREAMSAYVTRYGIEPPPVTVTDTGAIRRMGDPVWWRRRLRTVHGRALEREAITLGYVHRNREIYASTVTVERRAQQKQRNAAALDGTVAVNQYGEEFTLAELAARAVSNPRIRRGELMVRIAGFESIAKALDHVGVFFTVTAPSRMHPKATKGPAVFDNPKFDGTTPKQAQGYLCQMWAKCRAALARAGAAVYGFRIAEPHHDATPHWHLLLFMAAAVKEKVCEIFAKYARAEDAHEMTSDEARGARFKAIEIDWKRGSAAGYVAKYVSKNIDGGGYQVQGDIEGGDMAAVTPSHRVEAWAATWGIRQFQQIGGAPVGVWRELRRLKPGTGYSDTVEQCRAAADAVNWHRYNEVQGGTDAKRADRPLAVAYTREGERFNAEAGEAMPAPPNRYGEEPPGAVFGVRDCRSGRSFVTRVFRWEVKRCTSATTERQGGKSCCMSSIFTDSENTGSFHVGAGKSFGLGVDFAPLAAPWSPVNNCTRGSDGERGNESRRTGVGGEKRRFAPDGVAKGGIDTGGRQAVDNGNGGNHGRHGNGNRDTRVSVP